jgi:antitoxin CcdA
LPADLVVEAKRLGINLSQACEIALSEQVRRALGEEWKRENREAVESSNEYVRKHGLPLARYRQF